MHLTQLSTAAALTREQLHVSGAMAAASAPVADSFLSALRHSQQHHQIQKLTSGVQAGVLAEGTIKTVRLTDAVTSGRTSWMHWHRRMASGLYAAAQQVCLRVL